MTGKRGHKEQGLNTLEPATGIVLNEGKNACLWMDLSASPHVKPGRKAGRK